MILVTGGTGLVGSHLLYKLVRQNQKVRAIRRPESDTDYVKRVFALYEKDPENIFSRIEWFQADITDFESLVEALQGVDYVYHAAADVSIGPGNALVDINVSGTANVVNACLEVCIKKLCFVSSTSALGSAAPGKEITEDMQWTYNKYRSSYSVSKFKSEMEVWRGIAEGLQAVIVNPSIIIGAGDWKRSSSYLFTAVWNGLKFYTKGVTGYVDVHDVAGAMINLMESEYSAERYIISAENLSYREALEKIANALGRKSPSIHATTFLVALAWRMDWLLSKLSGKKRTITRDAARSGRRQAFFSNQKIRDAIGIQFKPIDESVAETAKIFLDQHQV